MMNPRIIQISVFDLAASNWCWFTSASISFIWT